MWSPAPRVSAAVAFALLAGTLSACAEPVSGPVLVLTLASPDSEVQDTAVPIKHFAEEVERLSQGTIAVEPEFGVPPPGSSGWDQYTARVVSDGDYDLGLVPSRAFDALGVDSLRALNTPFLIESEAAVEAVLDDGIREDLLAGLPAAGVVGLDLFPAGLRHPFGYDEPLLGAADYQDGTIRIALSETVKQMFAALGATVTDAIASSRQRGAEAAYAWAPGPIATGNVTYFPKVTTLVADAEVSERLRPDQWDLLRDAAAATRGWMYGAQATDFEEAAAYCADGGRIVAATAAQVASLRRATTPVVTALEEDAEAGPIIERIRELTVGLPVPQPVDACPGSSDTATTSEGSTEPEDPQLALLDGVYFAHVTAKDLRAAGVVDDQTVRENSGRTTWTLDSGTWRNHQAANHFVDNPELTGTYTYRDGLLRFNWPDGSWTSARIRVSRDGTLHFSNIQDSVDQALAEGSFQLNPWVRIGNLPT
jgi:hypothetical protein